MAATQSYDYSLTEHHIEPFQYADPNTAFLEEDADSYGDLWQFKRHITQYTFNTIFVKLRQNDHFETIDLTISNQTSRIVVVAKMK